MPDRSEEINEAKHDRQDERERRDHAPENGRESRGNGDKDPVIDVDAEDGLEAGEEETVDATIIRLQEESERNLENYQRAVAELANYRRRKDQEAERAVDQARRNTLLKFLPVVDDFDRALKSTAVDESDTSWLEGFRLIERKLWAVLEAEGVRPMTSVGQPFDPNHHEAVLIDDATDKHDTVIEEYQRGYFIDDHVLRPAMVKVGSADDIPTADS